MEVGVDITRTPPAEGDTPHAGTTPAPTLPPPTPHARRHHHPDGGAAARPTRNPAQRPDLRPRPHRPTRPPTPQLQPGTWAKAAATGMSANRPRRNLLVTCADTQAAPRRATPSATRTATPRATPVAPPAQPPLPATFSDRAASYHPHHPAHRRHQARASTGPGARAGARAGTSLRVLFQRAAPQAPTRPQGGGPRPHGTGMCWPRSCSSPPRNGTQPGGAHASFGRVQPGCCRTRQATYHLGTRGPQARPTPSAHTGVNAGSSA